VAGLTAAYLTRRSHDVTLFEKDTRLGGHADTHMVAGSQSELAIDTGFIVHNTRTYPTLLRLFRELGVATQDSSMSFGVSCQGCALEYSGGRGIKALLPRLRWSGVAAYGRMLRDIGRFHRHAREFLASEANDQTSLGEFLSVGDYSDAFCDHFLLPLSGAVWSCSPRQARSFPARYLLSFFANHGLLGVRGTPPWKTVVGGSRTYVEKVSSAMGGRIRVGAAVTALVRDRNGVTIVSSDGAEHRFGSAIVATHPDQALAILEDPSEDEHRVLGGFRYARNSATLHTDKALLPRSKRARSSWNCLLDTCATTEDSVHVTYSMNILQRLSEPEEYCVSLNADDRIDPATVLARMTYEHPIYTADTLVAQRGLPALSGPRNTYYCGAYHGWGFHEDGCLSGARAAAAVGGGWS
jgi:predicted NAD/FAD-binding protein